MSQLRPACLVVFCLVAVPLRSAAQTSAPSPAWLVRQPVAAALVWAPPSHGQGASVTAGAVSLEAWPPQGAAARDSLKNGAIIGALIGAAALGGFAGFLCHLYQEEDGPSCVPDTLRFVAIGAAIGAGAGVAVDAALVRRSGGALRFSLRF